MRLFLMISTLLVLAGPLQAVTISGGWLLEAYDEVGPRFYGTLPEGNITEIAQASSASYYYELGGFAPIPLPTYDDGTTASLGEILFTIRFSDIDFGGGVILRLESYWDGVSPEVWAGTGLDYSYSAFSVHSWAFRQGSVGAAPLDFGQLKSLFE
jgi:hypothetical protein